MRHLRNFIMIYAIAGLVLMIFVLLYLVYSPQNNIAQDVQDISDNTSTTDEPFITYIAPDEYQILQVWRYSNGEATRLTDVGNHVTQYDFQGNLLVYVSNATLWAHTPYGNTPTRTLTNLSLPEYGGDYAYAFPQISPDGSTVLYANNGLYRITLADATPELLLEDVQLVAQQSEPGDVRFYQESEFMDADTLLLHVGIWEAQLPAVYDLQTGNYQESEPYAYPAAYALSDGRLLLYGNSFRGMLSGLYTASADNLSNVTLVTNGNYGGVVPVDETIVLAVTETSPGQVRLLVSWITQSSAEPGSAIVDVDLATGTASLVRRITPTSDMSQLAQPKFTPDGTGFIGLANSDYSTDIYSRGEMVGQIARYDIASDSVEVLVDAPAFAIQQHTP